MNRWNYQATLQTLAPRLLRMALGWSVGLLFVLTLGRCWLAFGSGWDVSIGLMLTFSFSCWGAWACSSVKKPLLVVGLALICSAAWAFLQPWSLTFLSWMPAAFELKTLATPLVGSSLLAISAGLAFFPSVCSAAIVVNGDSLSRRWGLAGLVIACLFGPMMIGFPSGWGLPIWAAGLMCLVCGGLLCLKTPRLLSLPSEDRFAVTNPSVRSWQNLLLAFACGIAIAMSQFTTRQLIVPNLTTEFALMGGLLCGGLFAFLPGRWRSMALTTWASLLLVCYPWLTWGVFESTAFVSNALLLISFRISVIVFIVAPVGCVLAGAVTDLLRKSPQRAVAGLFVACCGMFIAYSNGLSSRDNLLMLLCGAGVLSLVDLWMVSVRSSQRSSVGWAFVVSCSLAIVAVVFPGRWSPGNSEKTLYSAMSYFAARNGVPYEQLAWLDDGRLMKEWETLRGRTSLWKHRGEQIVVRTDGIPSAMHSQNPDRCPQSSGEVLPMWLPLVLHPSAENVLLLEMHPTSIQTSEYFPLMSVTVVSDDPQTEQMRTWINRHLYSRDRYEFHQANLLQAVQARHSRKYDVIVSPKNVIATTQSVALLTEEYYSSVRGRLADGGLYCQRIAYYDIGADSLAEILSTFESVFPNLLVTESIPGEVLLVGAKSKEQLITKDVLQRFQTPHARQVLADMAWDWSIAATRGTLSGDSVRELIKETRTGFAANKPLSAFALPWEISRWGDKLADSRQLLAGHSRVLSEFIDDPEISTEIGQRIEDIQLAYKVMDVHPDNIWSYRVAIKNKLSDRPRSKIQQVGHDGLKNALHPEDQNRKNYLAALGKLTKESRLTRANIEGLVSLTEPYDPLVSPFARYEALQLLNRVAEEGSELQKFEYLLHSIYFSSPRDRSVRNVCEAMMLLANESAIPLTSSERWDHFNGLLEVLRLRWQTRIQTADSNQKDYELVDTERCLEATRQVMRSMTKLANEVGVSDSEWTQRQAFLETTLVDVLQKYRSSQMQNVRYARPSTSTAPQKTAEAESKPKSSPKIIGPVELGL